MPEGTNRLLRQNVSIPDLLPTYISLATGQEQKRQKSRNQLMETLLPTARIPETAIGCSAIFSLTHRPVKIGYATGDKLVELHENLLPLALILCGPFPSHQV